MNAGEHSDPIAFVILFSLSLIAILVLAFREFMQLWTDKRAYWKSTENWVELLILLFIFFSIVTMVFDKDAAVDLGAWAIFLAWWDFTMLIGRYPSVGIYIYMITGVTKTLLLFFMLYLPTLISFALVFHLFIPRNQGFANPAQSFLKGTYLIK